MRIRNTEENIAPTLFHPYFCFSVWSTRQAGPKLSKNLLITADDGTALELVAEFPDFRLGGVGTNLQPHQNITVQFFRISLF